MAQRYSYAYCKIVSTRYANYVGVNTISYGKTLSRGVSFDIITEKEERNLPVETLGAQRHDLYIWC